MNENGNFESNVNKRNKPIKFGARSVSKWESQWLNVRLMMSSLRKTDLERPIWSNQSVLQFGCPRLSPENVSNQTFWWKTRVIFLFVLIRKYDVAIHVWLIWIWIWSTTRVRFNASPFDQYVLEWICSKVSDVVYEVRVCCLDKDWYFLCLKISAWSLYVKKI